MTGIYRLKGSVKHYDWGGISFLPSLLSLPNEEGQPFAEYWLGVHPQDYCTLELPDLHRVLLKEYMQEHPETLGERVRNQFGHLPYLLKILDVHKMLSIQVHPSKAAAKKEFDRENAEGIAPDSPNRNYKDDNHKPELMVALGDFWLLHGFKPQETLIKILKAVPELNELLPVFQQSGYEALYKQVMTMPQEEVNKILQPLLDRIIPIFNGEKLNRSQEDYWAAKAALSFPHNGKIDRGIFSIYLFNLLHLVKGEAIFQDAGVPHAYLEGFNVEIMANSDNVLRGGLTTKYIDVKELLKHTLCEPTKAEIISGKPVSGVEKVYLTPAPDFQLSIFDLKAGDNIPIVAATAEILVLTEGIAELEYEGRRIILQAGNPSAIIFPGRPVQLKSKEEAVVFRASVPV